MYMDGLPFLMAAAFRLDWHSPLAAGIGKRVRVHG
jgi:hypothetical protein